MGETRASERSGDNEVGGGGGEVVDDNVDDGGGGVGGVSVDEGVGVVGVDAAPSASMSAMPSAATVCVRVLLRYAKCCVATSIISGSISHTHRRNAGRYRCVVMWRKEVVRRKGVDEGMSG